MELTDIKYLSEKRIKELNKLNIYNCEDLINNFPRNYLNLTKITPIKYSYHNDCILTIAKIETTPQLFNSGRLKIVKTYCSQQNDTFSIVWFNQPYVIDKLEEGKEYFFYGRVSNKFGLVSLTNPVFEEVDKNIKLKGLVPVYKITNNLTQSLIKNVTKSAVHLSKITSVIPYNLQQKYGLSDLKNAYFEVHNPKNENSLQSASDRIALEEYFSLISAFKVIKGDKKRVRLRKYNCSASELSEFISGFNFEFTEGQKLATNEIFKDLKGKTIMNRLLQGDVGCGKTAVSLCAVYMAIKSGYQVAFLAPTEVLATQNYNILKERFSDSDVVFLSGSVNQKNKNEIKNYISSGKAKIVVGTHAILENDVKFLNLGLCVCDEQQRFGVAQRSSLSDKGQSVDMLVMSATPIPRTLSLIFYGDLDISTIKDKPKSRVEISTGIVPQNKYNDMISFIDKEIEKGGKIYFVCPKIDGDDEGSIISVKELYDDLKNLLPNRKVLLMHGKLKDAEKNQIMQDFKDGNGDILVSTTVIEVGVDVKDATVMVIQNAERFGLSQLHQLRGRVGRGDKKSYCFLISENENPKSIERLNAIKSCSDGFKISEIDYDLRGGGDFLGERQSGKFLSNLGGLKYSSSVIFFAKNLSDEAFSKSENFLSLKELAIKKYEKLKTITLN